MTHCHLPAAASAAAEPHESKAAAALGNTPVPLAGTSSGPFNIGQAARQSGVSAKMIRHYETLGLLPAVPRTDAGYRQYGEAQIHTLRFIRRARLLGFSMLEIAELLKLWQNQGRASADVKRIALAHVADLERRIAEMQAMRQTLQELAQCCQGNQRPDCPILSGLAG